MKQGTFPSQRVRNWYRVVAIGLLNSVLLLLLLNLFLYMIIRGRRPTNPEEAPISTIVRSLAKAYPGWGEADVKLLLTETSQLKYEYEPFTGFKERAFRGRFVNIDPAGFRVSKDQAPWPPRPEAFKVFVFGGSNAFGFGLPDDETIPSYLQECARARDFSRPVAVYNFGQNGYFSSQERILFEQLLSAGFVPQVAVFIEGANEFWLAHGEPLGTDRMRRLMEGRLGPSPIEQLPMIKAAQWLSNRGAKPQPQKHVDYADPALLQSIAARWLANQRMIEQVAAAFGVRPIFVWQPVPSYKYDIRYHFLHKPGEGQSSRSERWRAGYSLMEGLRAQGKLSANVLWLADMQQDKHENLYVDFWHYNAAFSKEIAARICGSLTNAPVNHPEKTVAVAIH